MLHRLMNDRSGVTLLEVILAMIILGVAYISLLPLFSSIQSRSADTEIFVKAQALAEGLMEEIVSKQFDDNEDPPFTLALGAEEALRKNYDDVDDFRGFTQSTINGFPGFNSEVRVFYVDEAVSLDDSVAGPTRYKKIIVTVAHDDRNIFVELSTLATSRVFHLIRWW